MRKIFVLFLLFILVLVTGVFSAAAATLTVDGSCVDVAIPIGECDSTSDYSTIQAAIDAAGPNDTIDVLANTYVENISVNKSLTLTGPNAGQRGQWDRVAEAIIQGQVTVAAADVTIDGFTVTNPGAQYGISGTVGGGATDGITIKNNIIYDVGSTTASLNVKGVSFQSGTDNILIEDNWFNEINADDKSVNAIFFGDSNATDPSENVIIRDNYFSDIESQSKGGYGILLNLGVNAVGGGVPGAIIERNIFDTIVGGGWNHAIGLETITTGAQVLNNTFFDLTAGSLDNTAIFFEGNDDGDTVLIQGNRFLNNDFFGVAIHPNDLPPINLTPYIVDATNNWWNGDDGPSDPGIGNGALGTGTPVGLNVTFDPWSLYESVVPWSQGFESGTGGWFDFGGSIVQVPSTTDGITSADGSFHAYVSAPSVGSAAFTRFSGYSEWLPGGGYTAEIDVYLDPAWATGEGFQYSVASNGTDNQHIQDFIFHVSKQANGLWVAANNNADSFIRQDLDTPSFANQEEITIAGWYTLQHVFSDGGGVLQVEMNLRDSGGTLLMQQLSGGPDNYIPAITGGNRYGWFPTVSDAQSFAVDNAELCLGSGPCSLLATEITYQPEDEAFICDSGVVTINFNNVNDVYGYQFEVSYDDSKVTATGGWVNSWFDTTGQFIVTPDWDANCTGGNCQFAVTKTDPALPVYGSGPVATIELSPLVSGLSTLSVHDVVLTDIDGFEIPIDLPASDLDVYACGTADVSGIVELQGRLTPIDEGDVKLIDTDGNFPPTTVQFSAIDGSYSIPDLPVHPTLGSDYRFEATHLLYLGNELDTPPIHLGTSDVYDAATTRLWGGDANNDFLVDILDASCIGNAFLTGSTCGGTGSTDINADGVTNIQDLSIVGGNYDKATWQPW